MSLSELGTRQLCANKKKAQNQAHPHSRATEASNFLFETVEEGIVPHLIAYAAVIHGFFKLQEVDQALELYHEYFLLVTNLMMLLITF